MEIPFGVQSYQHEAAQLSSQQMINCFLEREPEGAKSRTAVIRTPGIDTILTLPKSPIRGAEVHGGYPYFVAGTSLYKVTGTTYTDLGTIPGASRVQMFSNGDQLGILANDDLYVYETSLAICSDASYGGQSGNGAIDVTYLDLYGIFVEKDSANIFINNGAAVPFPDLNDFDASDTAAAEARPGNITAIETDHRELFIFKEESAEIWTNTGNVNFPFQPVGSAFMEVGCIARDSLAKADNTIFWLANDMTVRRADGYTPMRISTHAIENEISKMTTRDDAIAFSHPHNGHLFYVLTFPTENKTFVYDITTGLWHQRETNGNEWRGGFYLYAQDTHYVGDLLSGKVGELSQNEYEDFDEVHRVSITSPSVSHEGKQLFFRRLHVDFEMGRGVLTGQGDEPQAMLQWSDDGGRTWSSEYWRDIGKIGEYSARAVWHRLGSSRDRVFRLQFSDPTPFTLISAFADVELGGS